MLERTAVEKYPDLILPKLPSLAVLLVLTISSMSAAQ